MQDRLRACTLGAGCAVATAAVGHLVEPLLPLGDWRWVLVGVAGFLPAAVLHRREIADLARAAWRRLTGAGSGEHHYASAAPVSWGFDVPPAEGTHRPAPPYARLLRRIRRALGARSTQSAEAGSVRAAGVEGAGRAVPLPFSRRLWRRLRRRT